MMSLQLQVADLSSKSAARALQTLSSYTMPYGQPASFCRGLVARPASAFSSSPGTKTLLGRRAPSSRPTHNHQSYLPKHCFRTFTLQQAHCSMHRHIFLSWSADICLIVCWWLSGEAIQLGVMAVPQGSLLLCKRSIFCDAALLC